MPTTPQYLSFTFAPHVLEDLGVNLYTSVAKALVEFIANAHDADAEWANISFDEAGIEHGREVLKADFELEKKRAERAGTLGLQPLAERTLPTTIQVTIEDNGTGMSRSDLENKFLVIGRRRRKGQEKTARTQKNRIVMGRKGLGKLAGFGIAHLIEVTSKVEGETHATRITLDLDALLNNGQHPTPTSTGGQNPATAQDQTADSPAREMKVLVPVETVDDGAGLIKGTRIVLKRLVYDAVRGELSTSLRNALAENFYGIKPEDFALKINGVIIDTSLADFAFAYPDHDTLAPTALVSQELPVDVGPGKVTFEYRIRFRPPKKQLPAKGRGVRVYAHKRLASAPDLLDVKSSAHGFQYTSYLDGVVVADFIDDQPTDYISTDRQSLRWDTPMLTSIRDFLTIQITKALATYADTVSAGLENKLKQDVFTVTAIMEGKLPAHRERTAWQIAKSLAGQDAGDLDSDFYRSTIKSVIAGLGHGEILATIEKLAEQDKPELRAVIQEITKLTRHEFDEFMTIIDARLRAIHTLSKLVEGVDFTASKNESDLHELFENNPWLIDPTFFEFMTSDQKENELARRLAQDLKISNFTPADYDKNSLNETAPLATNERPDLTFLLSNQALKRLIIVELKAPNTPLHNDHLNQLQGYMARAEEFLAAHADAGQTKVEGLLIGSRATDSKAEKVKLLDYHIKKNMGPTSPWRVFDILEVLQRTRDAHSEIWKAHKKISVAPAITTNPAPPVQPPAQV